MTEWIKCSEKPAPKDGKFLLWDGDYMSIGGHAYDNDDGTGVFFDGDSMFSPTHWAEQPKPPIINENPPQRLIIVIMFQIGIE